MKNGVDFIGQLIVEIIMGYHGGEASLSFCVVVTGQIHYTKRRGAFSLSMFIVNQQNPLIIQAFKQILALR